MTRTLAVLAALTALSMGFQAARDHAALIREGYEISVLERTRDEVDTEAARARERVERLSSPTALASKARELGLASDHPAEFPVVRVTPDRGDVGTMLVRGD